MSTTFTTTQHQTNMIDPVVCVINRADHPRRLVRTINQLRKVGLSRNIVRIEATCPEDVHPHQYTSMQMARSIASSGRATRVDSQVLSSWSQLACAASHMRAWRHLAHVASSDTLVVAEDTIEIPDTEEFLYSYTAAMHRVTDIHHNNSSMCLMGSESVKPPYKLYRGGVQQLMDGFFGLRFYIMNRMAANALLTGCFPLLYQLDVHIGKWVGANVCTDPFFLYNIPSCVSRMPGVLSSVQPVSNCKSSADDLRIIFAKCLMPLAILKAVLSYLPANDRCVVCCRSPMECACNLIEEHAEGRYTLL